MLSVDGALIVDGWGVVGWCRKSCLGLKLHLFQAMILAEEISMTHSDMFDGLDIFTFFLWNIAVSDLHSLEIYKNLGVPVSTFTFAVSSHADIHFHIYVFLFQILCSTKSVVFIRIQVKDFYIQIWFECETPLFLFLIRNMVYRKKLFT